MIHNLPGSSGGVATYTYDAAGVKRKVEHQGAGENKTTDYCGNVIYENGALSKILTEEGYITLSGTTPTYHYYLKDHLGNNRVVLNQNGTAVEQVNHYYPFGGLFDQTSETVQAYKYNGKELDRTYGIDLYDYSARFMDGAIGRFTTMDPLAEKYYSVSPYGYVMNNPMKFVDPDGRDVIATTSDAQRMILNTLPKEIRSHVQFDKNGFVNKEALINVKSDSQNFNYLKTMALSDKTLEVRLDDKFSYLDENGNIKEQTMSYLGIDSDFIGNSNGKGVGVSTGETGFLGKTLFPDKNGLQNSTNGNIIVIVNSNLSEEGRAQMYSHEANGHSYIYIITEGDRKQASHQYSTGGTDLNRFLYDIINNSINETIQNMK